MTWKKEPLKMNKLVTMKEKCNQLAELELRRIQQTAERMQQTVTLSKGK